MALKPRRPTITPESRFSKAPPGYSLTGTPGIYPWENPPEHTTAPEAVDAIIDNLEKPQVQEMYVQLLAAGVSIEELVGTMVRVGFMEGKFTVDVGELIKAPLAFYLMGLAADANIPANVFTTPDGMPRKNYGMRDAQILNTMRKRNPEFAQFITKEHPERLRQERAMMQERAQRMQGGFLGLPDMEQGEAIEGELVEQEMMEQGEA